MPPSGLGGLAHDLVSLEGQAPIQASPRAESRENVNDINGLIAMREISPI